MNTIDGADKPLIYLSNVKKAYKTEAGDFLALRHVDLTVEEGEFVGVIGKSGSGKSTLINIISGIDRATSGDVWVARREISLLKENDMAIWRGKNLGIVFQFFQLLPTLTVAENIMLPMDFANVYSFGNRRRKALDMLDLVELTDQADKYPSQLSGGQQQRIAIARALANDPPIIVADEPTGNLDSGTAEQIFTLFRNLVAKGKTILMVTHDNDFAKKVDRSIIIADGQIIEGYLTDTFSTLSHNELAQITKEVRLKQFEKGQVILREGDAVEHFYVIVKGNVEIVRNIGKKTEQIVEHLGPGDHFGEIELLHGGTSVGSARVKDGSVKLAELSKEMMKTVLEKSKSTEEKFHKTAQKRLAKASKLLA